MRITTPIIPIIAVAVLALAGCREDDGVLGGDGTERAYVTSDPEGARILVDDRDTGLRTPDTVPGLGGRHDLTVRMDTLDTTYGFTARVMLTGGDTVAHVHGPLVVRCFDPTCFLTLFRHYAANRLRFAVDPVGTLFHRDGTGDGILWPSVTNNSYASGGIPLFAGIVGADTVSLGIYDAAYLAGRPVPDIVSQPDRVTIRQSTWVLPPAQLLSLATIRGLRVDEQVLSTQSVDDAVVLRIVFHNITADPLYHTVDPNVPEQGVTFREAYVGFALDADIGEPEDDDLSYEPDLDLVFAYDAEFEETDFAGDYSQRPGLIGLRVLRAPAGTQVALNGWSRQGSGTGDWAAGTPSEPVGWGMLSGTRVFAPDDPSPKIGHLPPQPTDVRLSVSAGPLILAPGDSAELVIAVVLADPASGTFNPGTKVPPGNPADHSRTLYRVAENLFARAGAVEVLLADPFFVPAVTALQAARRR